MSAKVGLSLLAISIAAAHRTDKPLLKPLSKTDFQKLRAELYKGFMTNDGLREKWEERLAK